MSVASTTKNYKIAKTLYNQISNNFYSIENEDLDDEVFLIDKTLESIKRLNRSINGINVSELKNSYNEKIINIIQNNVNTFNEASYYIERALISMKLFDKLRPVLRNYIKDAEWKTIADEEKNAVLKFGRFLTNEQNYNLYKSFATNIIKGTLTQNNFNKLFNSISSRIRKPKRSTTKQRYPLPPSMWSKKDKVKWDKQKTEIKKDAAEKREKLPKTTFNFNESFISLDSYKKILK